MSGAETLGTTIMKQQLQKKHLVEKRSLNRFLWMSKMLLAMPLG